MLRSVASDLGLYCLPMSHKKDARLIWVKTGVCMEHFTEAAQNRYRWQIFWPFLSRPCFCRVFADGLTRCL